MIPRNMVSRLLSGKESICPAPDHSMPGPCLSHHLVSLLGDRLVMVVAGGKQEQVFQPPLVRCMGEDDPVVGMLVGRGGGESGRGSIVLMLFILLALSSK